MASNTVKKSKSNIPNSTDSVIELVSLPPEELNKRFENLSRQIEKVYASSAKSAKTSSKSIKTTGGTTSIPVLPGGSTGMPLSLGSKILKGATDSTYLKDLSGGAKTAATVLSGLSSTSGLVSKGLGLLSGSINPATLAFQGLVWATGNVIDAFVETYNRLKDLSDSLVVSSRYSASDVMEMNQFYTSIKNDLNAQFNAYKISNEDVATGINNAIQVFKNDSLAVQQFADEAMLLNEMGVNMQGSLGTMLRNQYYRSSKSEVATENYLNDLVSLSRDSLLSLEDIVAIQEESRGQVNLTAWTLTRMGYSADEAKSIADSITKSKVAATAAAADLGVSTSGIESIFNSFGEIISYQTDPTRLGDLVKKYQVGGMIGGKSIDEVAEMILSGKASDVFKLMISSASNTAETNSMGMEFLAKTFGSNIVDVLSTLGPDQVDALLTSFDKYYASGESSTTELQDVIAAKLTTLDDTLKGIWETLANSILTTIDPVAINNLVQGINNLFGFGEESMFSTQEKIAEYNTNPYTAGYTAPTTYSTNSTTNNSGNPYNGMGGIDDWTSSTDTPGTNPWRLSAGFKSPAYKAKFGRDHTGADYAAVAGTSLPSTIDGTVIATGNNAISGNYVKVQDSAGRIHTFAHLQSISVQKGQKVSIGTELGKVGSTGRSTGPHVHYQVNDGSTPINPSPWASRTFGGGLIGSTSTSSTYADTTTQVTPSLLSMLSYKDYSSYYSSRLATGGIDNTTMSTSTTATTRYTGNDTTSAIVSLTSMVSDKLDTIIGTMSMNSKYSPDLKNQFSYK